MREGQKIAQALGDGWQADPKAPVAYNDTTGERVALWTMGRYSAWNCVTDEQRFGATASDALLNLRERVPRGERD